MKNPEEKITIANRAPVIPRSFSVGDGVVQTHQLTRKEVWEQQQKELAEWHAAAEKPARFDPERVDYSNLEEILSPEGNALLALKQEHYNAKEFGLCPILPEMEIQWKVEEDALAATVADDEIELIEQRISGPVNLGSRRSFKRGKEGVSNPDYELFGKNLKARTL